MGSSPLRTVLRASDVTEASIAESYLVGHGIAVFLQDRTTASLFPELAAAAGGVRVQVAVQDYDDARALLADLDQGGFDYSDTGFTEADFRVGPASKSEPLDARPPRPWWVTLAWSLLFVFAVGAARSLLG
jgi:hypothetical protein